MTRPRSDPVVLFRDHRFVVLDKPAGLAVHPGPSGAASVEDWFPLLSRRKDGPWLAHRLDADTSGCLVIALRHAALLAAQACFASGTARKIYWAVVAGEVHGDHGVIDAPLRRQTGRSGWRMVIDAVDGQPAVTEWRVLGRAPGLTWLELHPTTGRTHQVRVHCLSLGAPIRGDQHYGGMNGGLHLLARSIRLPLHPPLEAIAAPPPQMLAALKQCGMSS